MEKVNIPRKGKTPIGGVYLGGVFNDGGGIIIFPGNDGNLHIKIIPPSAPVFGQLQVISGLASAAAASEDSGISRQLRQLAEKMLNDNAKEIGQVLAATDQ